MRPRFRNARRELGLVAAIIHHGAGMVRSLNRAVASLVAVLRSTLGRICTAHETIAQPSRAAFALLSGTAGIAEIGHSQTQKQATR